VPDVNIDVSDLVSGLDEKLADKNVKGNLRKAYVEMRKSLIDQNTGDVKNTTKLLHEGLYQDFTPLIEGLTKENQKFIVVVAHGIWIAIFYNQVLCLLKVFLKKETL
jgi:hypothetical protein